MKLAHKLLLTISLLLTTTHSYAYAPPSLNEPNHIIDTVGKLSSDEVANLNSNLDDFEKISKTKMAVLIMSSKGTSESLEKISEDTFYKWNFSDNGCLLVIDVFSKSSRLQTGVLVEDNLKDKEIIALNQYLHPYLLKDIFDVGIYKSFNYIFEEISKQPLPQPIQLEEITIVGQNPNSMFNMVYFSLLILISFAVGLIFIYKKSKYLSKSKGLNTSNIVDETLPITNLNKSIMLASSIDDISKWMYTLNNYYHEKYGNVIEIIKDNLGEYSNPFEISNACISLRKSLQLKNLNKIRYLFNNEIFIDSTLKAWANKEYKNLPKCFNCINFLNEKIYQNQFSNNFFCSLKCSDTNFDEHIKKIEEEEEECDYL